MTRLTLSKWSSPPVSLLLAVVSTEDGHPFPQDELYLLLMPMGRTRIM